MLKSIINHVVEENKSRKESEKSKLELEKIKLAQLEKELELANIRKESRENPEYEKHKLAVLEKELELGKLRNESSLNTSVKAETELIGNSLENLIKSVKTLTIPVPSRAESFNLFFQSLEKAYKTKQVPEDYKAEILLNILGEKASNLMIYVSDEDLNCYDKLKTIVLKEFQPTPRECINNFRNAQKLSSENYVQFSSRLSAMFDYYCQLRKVNDFKSLCELIVSDRIFESLDRELMNHIAIKQEESYFKPQQLGRECDMFLSVKGKSKSESNMFSRVTGSENKRFLGTKSHNYRASKGYSNVFLSEVRNVKCVLCNSNESHALY